MLTQLEGVEELLHSVWKVMLRSELSPGQDIAEGAEPAGDALYYEATIRGEWNGRVVLGCPQEHAIQLLAKAYPSLSNGRSAQDLVAELVNIVTGNLKGAIGGDTVQSTPESISVEGSWPTHSEQSLVRMICLSDGHPVLLAVLAEPGD